MRLNLLEDYSLLQVIIILGTYFFASSVKGVTGLGFSTVCLPFMVLTVGLKAALPLLIIPSLVSNLIVMRQAGHFRTTFHRFWLMLLTTVIGVFWGLALLSKVDGTFAGAILGLVLIFWCIFSYITPKFKLPAPKERPAGIISGLATGIINGLTGSQVVPCVPYLMALNLDRSVFIQATNISFTLSSLIMAIGLTRLELFTLDAIKISIAGLVLVYFGLKLGSKVRPFLSPDNFRLAVLVVLFITALGLLLKAF